MIPAPLKIVKLLLAEFAFAAGSGTRSAAPGLESTSGPNGALHQNLEHSTSLDHDELDDDLMDDDEDDDWEDDDQYGLGSSGAADFGLGTSKEALMAYADAGSERTTRRGPDMETRGYLMEFFGAAGRGQFKDWDQIVAALKPEEREILGAVGAVG